MAHVLSSPLALFIVQAVVVVVAARAIGLLTRKIEQPMVIAEVVAGILLGPSLLGWLAPEASRVLFPASSMGLLGTVSQIGLMLFMFIVGLELDPNLLKKRVHSSVVISHTSIIVPFVLGAVLGLRLYGTLAPENAPHLSFLLFMGAAMSITAFPVLARILVERRLLRSRVGAVTIACAAVDDVTAWCILAFVVSIVRSSGVGSAILTSGFALAYLGVMLFVVRPLLERLAERTKLGLSQNIVALVLVGLFLSSFVTELIGIHALFGAFIFGTNTRGLMELVVLNIGLDLGVISPKLFAMMVIMALVTTFATTPLLQWIYPTEELAKQLAEPPDNSVTDLAAQARARFTALVCVAYERSGPGLVSLAAALAGTDDRSGRIYALRLQRAADRASFMLDHQREKASTSDESALAPLMDRARDAHVHVRPLSFVTMDPARDICDVASVKQANVVLMGWHKPVFGTTMLSGTVHGVMRATRAAVGVFVDRGLGEIRSVLVPYLGREHDRAALDLARRIASNCGAKLTVLCVTTKEGERPPAASRSDDAIAEETKVVSPSNPIDAVITESQAGYDLVVIGIGSQWGLEHRSFGVKTEKVLANAPVSVLVVRGSDDAALAEDVPAAREPALADTGA